MDETVPTHYREQICLLVDFNETRLNLSLTFLCFCLLVIFSFFFIFKYKVCNPFLLEEDCVTLVSILWFSFH